MGKDLAEKYPVARQTFEEADEALGYKLSQLCFDGPEEDLRLTEKTQPAILTTSIAALRVLESQMPKPCYVAGHSLGEYSAHVTSGTFNFADAVRTVRSRGKYMQEATFGDQTYKIYKRANSGYIAFVATTNFTSGTVNLLEMTKWALAKGWLSSTSTVNQICFGVEMVSTDDKDARFQVTAFSIDAKLKPTTDATKP